MSFPCVNSTFLDRYLAEQEEKEKDENLVQYLMESHNISEENARNMIEDICKEDCHE